MTELNPLATSILGSVHQQRLLAIEKSRVARRAQVLEKNIAAEDDQLEHLVESSDQVHTISDDAGSGGQSAKRQPRPHHSPDDAEDAPDPKPHIDITG